MEKEGNTKEPVRKAKNWCERSNLDHHSFTFGTSEMTSVLYKKSSV